MGVYHPLENAYRWIVVSAIPRFHAGDSQPFQVFATFTDITERKRTEQALQESERRLAALISNLPGFVYRCANDPDWTMEFISDGCREVTGYEPEDLLNNSKIAFNDLVNPDHRERLWLKWQELLPQHKPFEEEYPIVHATGELRWVWSADVEYSEPTGNCCFWKGLFPT
jgi:PAS domain S-box-containing protein